MTNPHVIIYVAIVLLGVHFITAEPWIKVANFKEDLNSLKNRALRVQAWQDYLDKLTYERDTSLSGEDLVRRIADTIGKKFGKFIASIKILKKSIEDNFASFTSTSPYKRCCKLENDDDDDENLDHDSRFFTRVDLESACDLVSGSSTADVKYPNKPVIDAMRKNLADDPSMKWQYFGTEKGLSTIYPANKYTKPCGTYDPRRRSWYVEGVTPVRKEVVLVLDRSFSMRGFADAFNKSGPTLLDVMKEAASSVLDTLAVHDLVGLVAFNEKPATPPGCYSDGLAQATSFNVKDLKKYIKDLTSDGSTSFYAGVEKAFALFRGTTRKDFKGSSEKVILFLTDGFNNIVGNGDDSLNKIKALEASLNNTVVILTYLIGNSDTGITEPLLKKMANITFPHKVGTYTHVSDASQLRNKMAFFYRTFRIKTQETLFSLPYNDAFGLGMVTTATIPVYNQDRMIGVIGIDLLLNDFFSSSDFNRHYAFVIDLMGRAWVHPLLAITSDDQVSGSIDITALERNPEAVSVIASMKSGGSGNKTFISDHLQSIGDPYRDGVVRQNLQSTYYWEKVPGQDFSVCIVMVSGVKEGPVSESSSHLNKSVPFIYHRADLVPPNNLCRHFQRISTRSSVVKFSAQCFKDPVGYMQRTETKDIVEEFTEYMTYEINKNTWFLDDIRSTVTMTAKADEIWQTHQKIPTTDYIAWRYIGTNNGVIRTAPMAPSLAKAYDPTYRRWYERAKSQPGISVFSTPYLDAFGGGFVVTMSHTLYKGKSGKHSKSDTILAVLGLDFTLSYFYQRLQETFPKCQQTGFQCFIMDNSGFLVIHKDLVEAKKPPIPDIEYVHITVKDPSLARHLIENGYMKEQGCINLEKMRDQVSWKVDFGSKIVMDFKSSEPKYEVSSVDKTNIFLVIKQVTKPGVSTPCSCIADSKDSVNKYMCGAIGSCQCPCYNTTSYLPCKDRLVLTNTSYMSCPPRSPSLTIPPITAAEKERAKKLNYCYQTPCGGNKKEVCMGLIGCSWCARDKFGNLLSISYCKSQEFCFLGVECMPDPYKAASVCQTPNETTTAGLDKTDPGGGPEIVIGSVVAAILVVVVVLVTAILFVRKRKGLPPFADKSSQPIELSTLPSNTDTNSHRRGISNPVGPNLAECFDPPIPY